MGRHLRHGDEDIKVTTQPRHVDPHTSYRLREPPGDIDGIGVFGIVRKNVKEKHPRAAEDEVLSSVSRMPSQVSLEGNIPKSSCPSWTRYNANPALSRPR